MLETVWSGLWDAAKAIANPRLDEYVMNDREKEIIRKAIRENPKDRLTDAGWLLKNAAVFRDISDDTKAEVYQICAESGVCYLKKLGLDIADGVAENVEQVAATTACLFFGFLDGATTISESYGGGGGNNELPKKKDNEDDLSFARRCHQMTKAMHAPRYRLRRG